MQQPRAQSGRRLGQGFGRTPAPTSSPFPGPKRRQRGRRSGHREASARPCRRSRAGSDNHPQRRRRGSGGPRPIREQPGNQVGAAPVRTVAGRELDYLPGSLQEARRHRLGHRILAPSKAPGGLAAGGLHCAGQDPHRRRTVTSSSGGSAPGRSRGSRHSTRPRRPAPPWRPRRGRCDRACGREAVGRRGDGTDRIRMEPSGLVAPAHRVVEQDASERRPVPAQRPERATRHLAEGGVRRGKHRERPVAGEGLRRDRRT